MEKTQTPKSATKRRRSEKDIGLPTSSHGTAKRRRYTTMDIEAEGEINQMELRSGRSVVKYGADSMGLTAESRSLVEDAQIPSTKVSQTKNRRKSVQIGKEQEAETSPLVGEAQMLNIKVSQTKNRRKDVQAVNKLQAETSPSLETAQTPSRNVNQTKNRRKTMQIVNQLQDETSPLEEKTQTLIRNISPTKNSGKSMQIVNEQEAETSPLAEKTQTPNRKVSSTKNRRKSMLIVSEQEAETSPLIEKTQTPKRKVSSTKNRRKSMLIVSEQEVETSPLVEKTQTPNRKVSSTKNRMKSMLIVSEQEGTSTSSEVNVQTPIRKSIHIKWNVGKENEEPKLIDLTLPSQECEVSSTQVIEDTERNCEFSVPISDKNEEDVEEILNSTFEVPEEDSILQTPARKRSVRFAASVETRRQTESFSDSVDDTPKFSTPVSMNSKRKSSHHKGTPHPSSKKRPASILKSSSSKNFPSSSKDKSLSGKLSARKMPNFSSIHKAQFEKMESIDEFNSRRRKCARKLAAEVVAVSKQVQPKASAIAKLVEQPAGYVVADSKKVQPKPSAIIKPLEQTVGNPLSRIPLAQQNTSRHGTPRALSSSHIPVPSFRALTEKNFNARQSTPHTMNSRQSSTKIGSNSRLKPVNNPKPQRINYQQAKAMIQNKKPLADVKREAKKEENRNVLKGVRLNRRFELQMQHRKLNI